MEVRRLESGSMLSPFGEPVRASLVANEALERFQARAIAGAGLTLAEGFGEGAPPGGALALFDDVLVSREALRAFAAAAPGQGRAVFALGASLFARSTRAGQGNVREAVDGAEVELMDLFWLPPGERPPTGAREEVAAALRAGARRVVIDPKETIWRLPVPPGYFGQDELEIALAARPALRVRHWMHLLRANQLAIGLRWGEQPRWRLVLQGLWAALRAMSLNKHRVLGKLNVIGKGCDIHPTAVVEGSVLGDGCVVGPYARVHFSTLGERAVVQGGAQVQLSTVGSRAMVSQNVFVNFCVLYPGAGAGGNLQLTILGRGAVTTIGTCILDTHFGPPVKVGLGAELIDSEQPFLGCALGHGAVVGSGVWIPAGREIPSGVKVVRDPAHVGGKLDPEAAGAELLTVRDGRLVPLTRR